MAKKKSEKKTEPGGESSPVTYERRHVQVHVEQLRASPLNPRRTRAADYDEKLRELAESIAQLGVIEAPVVRQVASDGKDAYGPPYEVLAGERRWRASMLAAERVPQRAWIDVVEVVDVPDDVAFRIAVAENDQREDMHPIDQCDAFVRLRDEQGASIARIATLMGRTEAYVYERMRLETLTAEGRAAFVEKRISLGVGLLLARLAGPAQDATLRKLLMRYGDEITIQAAREEVRRRCMVIDEAPFDTKDPSARGGACVTCPKRSEAQQQLFGDLLGDGGVNRCTDPECWDAKVEDHWAAAAQRAAERGLTVADDALARKIFPTPYGPAGGHVDLDSPSFEDPSKTWRQQLEGVEGVEVVLVRDPNGRPREIAAIGALERARRAEERAKLEAEAKEREQGVEIGRLVHTRVRDAIVTAIRNRAWTRDAFWLALTEIMVRWWDQPPLDAAARARHGLDPQPATDGDEIAELVEAARGMKDADQLALIVDLVIDGTNLMRSAKPNASEAALLSALGVDWQAISKAAAKAVKQKARAA